MTANEIYTSILKSVPEVKTYQTPIGKIVDAKKYNSYIERISLEEQIWNRCKPDKELANEVYELFMRHSLADDEADTRSNAESLGSEASAG